MKFVTLKEGSLVFDRWALAYGYWYFERFEGV